MLGVCPWSGPSGKKRPPRLHTFVGSVAPLIAQLLDDAHEGGTRFVSENSKTQFIEDYVVYDFAIGFVGRRPTDSPASEGARVNRTGHRIFGAEDADLRPSIALRLIRNDLSNVKGWHRKGLSRRFQRDMGSIVGANEEVASGRRQLLRVSHEEASQLFIIAPLPGTEH